jgi:N-acetylglucosaminyldiphosphoundecaprenol N-acetyl-beta-D-mannosaminyltransferase
VSFHLKNRLKILNIWVDPVDRKEAIQRVKYFLTEGTRPHAVIAANPEKNFSVPKDAVLYDTFKNADLLLPDGIGIVLAARILYGANLERVPGSEFIFDICDIAAKGKYKVFIYGAKEKVNKNTVEELKKRYPDIEIAGRASGYVKDSDMPDLIDRINASEAQILFLALGSPRQEEWYATYKNRLHHVRVVQGVGGTLDTIAGTVKRAPEAWCNLRLEWLYRLIMEPKRIKRQKVLPIFAAMVLISKFKTITAGRETGED